MTPPKSDNRPHQLTVPVDEVTARRLDEIQTYADSIGVTVEEILQDSMELHLAKLLKDPQRVSESAPSAPVVRVQCVRGAL